MWLSLNVFLSFGTDSSSFEWKLSHNRGSIVSFLWFWNWIFYKQKTKMHENLLPLLCCGLRKKSWRVIFFDYFLLRSTFICSTPLEKLRQLLEEQSFSTAATFLFTQRQPITLLPCSVMICCLVLLLLNTHTTTMEHYIHKHNTMPSVGFLKANQKHYFQMEKFFILLRENSNESLRISQWIFPLRKTIRIFKHRAFFIGVHR